MAKLRIYIRTLSFREGDINQQQRTALSDWPDKRTWRSFLFLELRPNCIPVYSRTFTWCRNCSRSALRTIHIILAERYCSSFFHSKYSRQIKLNRLKRDCRLCTYTVHHIWHRRPSPQWQTAGPDPRSGPRPVNGSGQVDEDHVAVTALPALVHDAECLVNGEDLGVEDLLVGAGAEAAAGPATG